MRRPTLVAAVLGIFVLTACGGNSPETASSAALTTDATPDSESTVSAPVISDDQLATAAAVGDIAAGEKLFNEPLDGVTHSLSCSSCHSLDGKDGRNPTIVGISAVVTDRIDGMSDVDYLRQSIIDPYAYTASGEWNSAPMPYRYSDLLTETQINDLIAFLLTR